MSQYVSDLESQRVTQHVNDSHSKSASESVCYKVSQYVIPELVSQSG